MDKQILQLEVVYANEFQQWILPVDLPAPVTIRQAIERSGILNCCDDIDLSYHKVGIFGVIMTLDSPVKNGDRIEIYRPLETDPIEKRFQRVAVAKKNHVKKA
jgi:putative ubiquitin-RnfH superfamily antitoxin RatB of RatAB toxin-antitoxin module